MTTTASVELSGRVSHEPDLATLELGTKGPFESWDGDQAALVHVLWEACDRGLTLADNADEIATLIRRSRWLAANRA